MTEAVLEKDICENCGVDVREGTAFCYNCGVPVSELKSEEVEPRLDEVPAVEGLDVDAKTKAALDDLAEKLKFDEEEDKKLAKAAAERRKARVSQRKTSREFTWESADESPGISLLLATLLIAILAALIVQFTVIWK